MKRGRFGAAVACVAVIAAAGCAASRPSTYSSAHPSATAGPAQACAQLVGYWAEQEATPNGDWGLDYQEMGLSQGENAILVALLPAARSLAARQGTAAVGPEATRWALPRCRAYTAAATASAKPGGWPQ